MVRMTEPQSNNPPPPPSSDDAVPTGADFMSTYYTAELMGTENKGQDRPSAVHETREGSP
ncbi:MAG: hypothetical protein JWR81_5430 [Pseudonocardia sp.]|jgi:hypothetical protein|nr:hypothetical protein [Pseudonocardia sp.]